VRLETARIVGISVRLRSAALLLMEVESLADEAKLANLGLDAVEIAAHLQKLQEELLADLVAPEVAAYGAAERRRARLSVPSAGAVTRGSGIPSTQSRGPQPA
jgi:uncharacterized membrane protein